MQNFEILPIEKLFESPLNPRQTYNAKKMTELIESIKAKGILTPLIVRPDHGDKNGNRYEIGAGHRRYRAAKEAGLSEVPVNVREMSDADFLELLTIENLQREDLQPLDEAQGYKTLMENNHCTVADIAAKLGKGKSESYIYQRIKLLELIPEAQKQLAEEKITAGHAILVARLQPEQQKEALKECFQQSYGGKRDEALSVRQLSEWIDHNIHLDLNKTSFPKKDATLLPEAGPCMTCPKRTGFAPALFPDIQKKDICTDPKCFHAKVAAYIAQWSEKQAQDTDQPPLRLSQAWNNRLKKLPEDPQTPIPRDLYHEIEGKKDRCSSVREAIMVDGHEQGQVKQICVDPKCEKHHGHQRYSSPESQKWKAEQKARQEKEKLEETVRLRIIDAILPSAGELSKNDLAFLAFALFDELLDEHRKKLLGRHDIKPVKIQYGFDQMTPMKKHIESCSTVDLGRLLMEMALIRHREKPHYVDKRRTDTLLETAKRYKVDPEKIEAEFRAEVKEKARKKAPQKAKAVKSGSVKQKGKRADPPKAKTIPMKDLCKLHGPVKKKSVKGFAAGVKLSELVEGKTEEAQRRVQTSAKKKKK